VNGGVVNEGVIGGEFDMTSLVSDLYLDIGIFLHCECIGNSMRGIPSLSLFDHVRILFSLNKEVILSLETLGLSGFSA